jgi:cytochrome P450
MSGETLTANGGAGAPHAPGPRGHWLLGSIPEFQRDPLALLMRGRAEFGDVVRFRYFGPFTWIFFAHPDDVQHVLLGHYQDYRKGVFADVMRLALGNGLVTADGSEWQRQRRQLQPRFHHHRLAPFAEVMTDVASDIAERWRPLAKAGEPIDITTAMQLLTLRITGRTLFSNEVGDTLRRIERFMRAP